MLIPKFTAEHLAAYEFTDAELARYDTDTPQPGMPGAWIIGIQSTERDYAMYYEYRCRKAVDFMTNYNYDPELEADKIAAAKRSPLVHRQRSTPKTIDDWLAVLPPLRRAGRMAWHGPCPLCGEGEDRFSIKEGKDGTVLLHCRGCRRRDVSQHDFYRQLCDRYFPRDRR